MTCVSAVSLLPFMGINLPARDNFVTCPVRRQKISPVPSLKRKPFSFENNLDAIQGGTHGVQPLSCLTPKPKSRLDYLPKIQEMNRKWINECPNEAEKKTREVVAKKIEDCFLHQKEELDLSRRTISPNGQKLTSLPPMIGTLFHLKDLNVSGHAVTKLPTAIKFLKKLKFFDADNNLLEKLPEEIGELKKLNFLKLDSNRLSCLPKSIGNLSSLYSLSLMKNNLETLPEAISGLSFLYKCDLSFNKLEKLPKAITELPVLTHLDLSHNNLKKLPEFMGKWYYLGSLDLSHNNIEKLPEEMNNRITLPAPYLMENGRMKILPGMELKRKNIPLADIIAHLKRYGFFRGMNLDNYN